jgi:hypothetical protein
VLVQNNMLYYSLVDLILFKTLNCLNVLDGTGRIHFLKPLINCLNVLPLDGTVYIISNCKKLLICIHVKRIVCIVNQSTVDQERSCQKSVLSFQESSKGSRRHYLYIFKTLNHCLNATCYRKIALCTLFLLVKSF